MPETIVNILIADDHPMVREGLKRILSENPGFSVSGEAGNGPEVIEKIRQQEWDVVLLDLSMPGTRGLDILKQIQDLKPRLPVLIVSARPEEQYAIRALKAGAAGYVSKETSPSNLMEAIKKVSQGGRYVSSTLAERLAQNLSSDFQSALHETLSDREFLVLRLIAEGKTASEIARELALSVKTISTYRTRILSKLKFKNNAELIRYALQERLFE